MVASTIISNFFWLMWRSAFLPIYDPINAITISPGTYTRYDPCTYPCARYITIRLKSTHKSIAAEVAINTSLDSANDASVKPLIAPPVPMSQAKTPAAVPPLAIQIGFLGILICLANNSYPLVATKNTHNTILKKCTPMYLDPIAHAITPMILGIPIHIKAFLSMPFWNKYNFDRLLDTCNILVRPSIV